MRTDRVVWITSDGHFAAKVVKKVKESKNLFL